MRRSGHLVAILRSRDVRRLLAVRLWGQFGDGIFQASLAGTVLFNPERQARAADVAAGFAVLLLPYSLVGPFAGVLIDRWWRQRILVRANAVRALGVLGVAAEVAAGVSGVPFYASALVVLSIGRFALSALSASLPRVVDSPQIVTANAFAATAGTIVTALGGAAAILARAVIGSDNAQYALLAAMTAVPCAAAAAQALRFERTALGPSLEERRARRSAGAVLRGLAAGARTVRATPAVARSLLVVATHRLGYGIWLVCTVLLYRNRYSDDGLFRAGLAGLGQVLAAVAVGGALAALVTPAAFRRFGFRAWIAATLVACSAAGLLGLAFTMPASILAALVLTIGSQSMKLTVDTVVQQQIDDEYRGRVFAIYDMLFNLALVLAAAITAAALPEDGHSPPAIAGVAIGWLLVGAAYLTRSARTSV